MATTRELNRNDYIARAFAFLTLLLAIIACFLAFRAHNIANTALQKANDNAKHIQQVNPTPAITPTPQPTETNGSSTPGEDSFPSNTGTGPGSSENSLLGQ